jgi:hypothetical protein
MPPKLDDTKRDGQRAVNLTGNIRFSFEFAEKAVRAKGRPEINTS